MTPRIRFVPRERIMEIDVLDLDPERKVALIANMCRVNTLSAVKRAGSGHLGTSLSAMDIFCWLMFQHLNTRTVGFDSPDRDIFFSSKGHDVPGFYSVLYALGLVSLDELLNIRRLGGLEGHPDVSTPGVEANTGSLGMGISKAKGMAWAKHRRGHRGRVYVLTGDGELQEGQIFESMQTAVHQGVNDIVAIVDHNKCQTENAVEDVISLGDLEAKFRAFGWHTARCDGHDFGQLRRVLADFETVDDKPKVLIADTVKGRGVSFMEHPFVLEQTGGVYRFHAGAPSDEEFNRAIDELCERVDREMESLSLDRVQYLDMTPEPKRASGVSAEFVAVALTDELIELAEQRADIVLLDADLLGDAKLQRFRDQFPEQFIENGIAEQDMASAAGGLALQGLLPFVNSFASFLCARANEQIYNNASERTKIVYINLYAGLIPAGPGKSHQSLRDIALMGSIPHVTVVHPGNAQEIRAMVRWCAETATETCAIRTNIGPSPRIVEFGPGWELRYGQGTVLRDGSDGVLFAYGPVMLNEALVAADVLADGGYDLRVVDMPWINRFDEEWLTNMVADVPEIFVLEDHGSFGGLGDHMLPILAERGIMRSREFRKFGIDTIPACGTPPEVLRHHQVDGASVAARVLATRSVVHG